MTKRKLSDGSRPIVGYLLALFILLAFIGLSMLLLFSKITFAPYIYVLISLFFTSKLSEIRRNDFLKICFGNERYGKIRMLENMIIALPFVIFLICKRQFYLTILLIVITILITLINIQFDKGNVYGIVGENGAGKTTLFRCIAGLENYDGQINSELNPLKNYLGLLLTEPFFFTKITGKEYIRLLCNARKKEVSKIDDKNIFDLPLNQYASTYSTGIKKKLALLAILLQDNQCFILDEPFKRVAVPIVLGNHAQAGGTAVHGVKLGVVGERLHSISCLRAYFLINPTLSSPIPSKIYEYAPTLSAV